ncbi:MAG: hypothetical protein JWQ97_1943 [Phenylobacterium sp.]|nr:hypothetical protein [Phenylobacterium sp.]
MLRERGETQVSKAWRRGGCLLLLALTSLAACGPAKKSQTSASPAPAEATAPATPAPPVPAPASPAPARTPMTKPATAAAFAAALGAEQDQLKAADEAYMQALRTAFRSGAPRDAAALVAYANALQTLQAELPAVPRLPGCLARAAPALAAARAAVTAAIAHRQARVQALAAITDRALSLPDYGGVASDPAAAMDEQQQVRAALARAQAAEVRCRRPRAQAQDAT